MCDIDLQQYLLDKQNLNTSNSWTYFDQSEWTKFPNFFSSLRLPINIETTNTIKSNNDIDINYKNNVEGILVVYKQTVFFFPDVRDNFVMYNDKKYFFIGYHIHNSSENTIDGLLYPIEIHFVNKWIDPETGLFDFVVIALLFELTNKDGAEITNLDYNNLYFGKNYKTTFDLSIFNNINTNKHYCFDGTLTSPPFFQNTRFYLFEPKNVTTTNLSINDHIFDALKFYFINNKANVLAPNNKARYIADPNNYLAIKEIHGCCNCGCK